jgi:hypothetical protein
MKTSGLDVHKGNIKFSIIHKLIKIFGIIKHNRTIKKNI